MRGLVRSKAARAPAIPPAGAGFGRTSRSHDGRSEPTATDDAGRAHRDKPGMREQLKQSRRILQVLPDHADDSIAQRAQAVLAKLLSDHNLRRAEPVSKPLVAVLDQTVELGDEPGTLPGEICLLYTSDAADDLLCVDLGGRR